MNFGYRYRLSATLLALLLLLASLAPRPTLTAPGGDGNIHWNELYHNDTDYAPETETVPTRDHAFRVRHGDGSANLYALALSGDLTGATVVWETAADGWADHEVAMSLEESVTAAFHGTASATYDLWKGTVPAQPDDTVVYYRIRAVDEGDTEYLKNNGSTSGPKLENPLGQWVWEDDVPATEGNWGYTAFVSAGPDLSASAKTVNPSTTSAGDTLTYTLTLQNAGSAATVHVTDTLPAEVTVSDALSMTEAGGNTLTWSGSLQPESTVVLHYLVTVNGGVSDTTLSNVATIDAGDGSVITRTASVVVPGQSTGPCAGATEGDSTVVSSEIYHNNLDVAYRDPVGTVSMTVSPTLKLRACHGDLSTVQVLVWETGEPLEAPGRVLTATAAPSGTHDLWTVEVPPPATTIDQWYQFKVVDGNTTGYYHPASGNAGPGVWYTASSQQNPSWSLPRDDDGPPPPPDCTGAAVGDGAIHTGQLYHVDTDGAYRDPLGNIDMGMTATLRLRTCLTDVSHVAAWVWKTDAGATPSYVYTATVAATDADYAYWELRVPAPDILTDQWYQFRVEDGTAGGYYHPASGNSGPGAWSTTAGTSWKLGTTAGPIPDVTDVPSWIADAVIYQIFPDRFRNGDTGNDALIEGTEVYGNRTTPGCNGYPHTRPGGYTDGCIHDLRGWNDGLLYPSWGLDFYGGDLQGITEKINAGYFNDLGVNTLYLNPIFDASSNHGYDTNDYYQVRDYFGGDAAFDDFMAAAQSHDLRVILDAVFNHAGMDSSYIDWDKDTYGACAATDSPLRPWFTSGSQGLEFSCAGGWGWKGWSGYGTIPELVDDNGDVRDFFFRGGSAQSPISGTERISVSDYWIRKGISGWRYDVAQDISHDWFQEMRPYLKDGAHYGSPEILLIGEVTGGCASGGLYESYTRGNELDSVMNYCFRDWVSGYASGNPPSNFANALHDFRAQYPPAIFYAMMNLISTHDSPRLLNLVGGDYANIKLAVLLQMTLPGAPSVYYGDEVGLPGGGDPDNRRTYPWTDTGAATPDPTMYAHFKSVIGIRNAHSALRGGDYAQLLVDDAQYLYSFIRWDDDEQVVVALKNSSGGPISAEIPVSAYFEDGTVLTDTLNGGTAYTVQNGKVTVPVHGKWGVILVGPQYRVTRAIDGAGSYDFGDACARLDVTDPGGLTEVTVEVEHRYPTGQVSGKPLPRTYTLQGNVSSGFTATLALCYEDAELWPGAAESALQLYRYAGGGSWQPYASTVDAVGNTVSAPVNAFSVWTIGAAPDHEPTALRLHGTRSAPSLAGMALLGLVGLLCALVRPRESA